MDATQSEDSTPNDELQTQEEKSTLISWRLDTHNSAPSDARMNTTVPNNARNTQGAKAPAAYPEGNPQALPASHTTQDVAYFEQASQTPTSVFISGRQRLNGFASGTATRSPKPERTSSQNLRRGQEMSLEKQPGMIPHVSRNVRVSSTPALSSIYMGSRAPDVNVQSSPFKARKDVVMSRLPGDNIPRKLVSLTADTPQPPAGFFSSKQFHHLKNTQQNLSKEQSNAMVDQLVGDEKHQGPIPTRAATIRLTTGMGSSPAATNVVDLTETAPRSRTFPKADRTAGDGPSIDSLRRPSPKVAPEFTTQLVSNLGQSALQSRVNAWNDRTSRHSRTATGPLKRPAAMVSPHVATQNGSDLRQKAPMSRSPEGMYPRTRNARSSMSSKQRPATDVPPKVAKPKIINVQPGAPKLGKTSAVNELPNLQPRRMPRPIVQKRFESDSPRNQSGRATINPVPLSQGPRHSLENRGSGYGQMPLPRRPRDSANGNHQPFVGPRLARPGGSIPPSFPSGGYVPRPGRGSSYKPRPTKQSSPAKFPYTGVGHPGMHGGPHREHAPASARSPRGIPGTATESSEMIIEIDENWVAQAADEHIESPTAPESTKSGKKGLDDNSTDTEIDQGPTDTGSDVNNGRTDTDDASSGNHTDDGIDDGRPDDGIEIGSQHGGTEDSQTDGGGNDSPSDGGGDDIPSEHDSHDAYVDGGISEVESIGGASKDDGHLSGDEDFLSDAPDESPIGEFPAEHLSKSFDDSLDEHSGTSSHAYSDEDFHDDSDSYSNKNSGEASDSETGVQSDEPAEEEEEGTQSDEPTEDEEEEDGTQPEERTEEEEEEDGTPSDGSSDEEGGSHSDKPSDEAEQSQSDDPSDSEEGTQSDKASDEASDEESDINDEDQSDDESSEQDNDPSDESRQDSEDDHEADEDEDPASSQDDDREDEQDDDPNDMNDDSNGGCSDSRGDDNNDDQDDGNDHAYGNDDYDDDNQGDCNDYGNQDD